MWNGPVGLVDFLEPFLESGKAVNIAGRPHPFGDFGQGNPVAIPAAALQMKSGHVQTPMRTIILRFFFAPVLSVSSTTRLGPLHSWVTSRQWLSSGSPNSGRIGFPPCLLEKDRRTFSIRGRSNPVSAFRAPGNSARLPPPPRGPYGKAYPGLPR